VTKGALQQLTAT